MLTFDETRFIIVLILTFDFIILINTINFTKDRNTDASQVAKFLVPFLLLMANIVIFASTVGSSGSITLTSNTIQYINSIETSVSFSFILSLISVFLVLWFYSGKKNSEFLSGSLLLSQLSLLLLAISLVTGLVSPSFIPASIRDYLGIAITAVVGVVFEVIRRAGSSRK